MADRFIDLDPDDVMATNLRKPPVPVEVPDEDYGVTDDEEVTTAVGGVHEPPAGYDVFQDIVDHLSDTDYNVRYGTFLGNRALGIGGRAFAVEVGDDVAFYLTGDAHHNAWKLDDSLLWDPDGEGDAPPQSNWVLVRHRFADRWQGFAEAALESSYRLLAEEE